ncbi:multisubunit sodium/hydrogen antiporter, MnhG subunit [Thermococcus kodakarensis KOD1]|uniref:Multisubunit sodium/hydrogen antiporter, MnhG subunit n=1 Tax=Thermococcus kodakarensis (strain ATCC BAA-918 / JCM 12380 / KOD1) TaxID=69014 RepID=Q5JDM2_THEKO|nr:monovalent cation/H(+) antiporter subunit G [Thermococcus kodakarensis]WCN28665.1 monovalent cation/H(+) antiporter subunit G [Thermococcus kodakarensis]WCN30963.1 monovalent cation/H(+) antiporter subunit G [Thermococcus kodakarensis]BAD84809.1 multisubunit sodium/hydrogen antiporter, MnhG subunit [Thermococcus kodakarensis KOD1]
MIELLFLLFGLFIMFFGALGLLRFPDVYTRLHATAKCDTGGAINILLALALASDFPLTGKLKFLVIAFTIAMINPMVSHAIARAAYKSGIKPKAVVDMYAWDNP